MTSFLTKKKTRKSFDEKISTEPAGTQRCKKYAVKIFASDFHPQNSREVNFSNEFLFFILFLGDKLVHEGFFGVLNTVFFIRVFSKFRNNSINVTFCNEVALETIIGAS